MCGGGRSRPAQNVVGMAGMVWAAVVMLSSLGCGGEASNPSATSAARPAATAGPAAAGKEVDRKHPVVRIDTSQGAIVLRLDAASAPGTVRNFLNYAAEGFYDNTIVHYVDQGNMILAGGYTSDRQPKTPHAPIRNEAHNGRKNVRGTVAMARDQALIDNATSQFFINLADAPQRDHKGQSANDYGYCVFGEVTEGLDVADRIAESPTTDLGGDLVKTPDPPILIKSIRAIQ